MRKAALPFLCSFLFLAAALPGLGSPGLNHDEGYQAAEAIFFIQGDRASGPAASISGIGTSRWFLGRWPWMTLDYIGALKTYLLALVFSLFGISLLTIRGLSVALGAGAVFFGTLLVEELYGLAWAAGFGIWLATDPALVLISRNDFGSVILSMTLKLAALYFFVAGARGGKWRTFVGGVLCGLALWDKAHFLWWLAALTVSAPLCLPKRIWYRPRSWAQAAAGFVLGALPWFAYNVAYPLATFSPLRNHPARDPSVSLIAVASRRLGLFFQMLSGSGFYRGFSGILAPTITARVLLWVMLALACAAALGAVTVKQRWEGLRHTAFWLAAAALILIAACVTPLSIGLHHMPMIYPLPQLAVISLLACATAALRWSPTNIAVLAFPLSLALATSNLLFLKNYRIAVSQTGGAAEWYTGLKEVARLCAAKKEPVVTMNLMYGVPLVVYTKGKVLPTEGYPDMTSEAGFASAVKSPPAFLSRPGTLVVTYEGPDDLYRPEPLPRRFMDDYVAQYPSALKLVEHIPYSDGRPWTAIYEVTVGED